MYIYILYIHIYIYICIYPTVSCCRWWSISSNVSQQTVEKLRLVKKYEEKWNKRCSKGKEIIDTRITDAPCKSNFDNAVKNISHQKIYSYAYLHSAIYTYISTYIYMYIYILYIHIYIYICIYPTVSCCRWWSISSNVSQQTVEKLRLFWK